MKKQKTGIFWFTNDLRLHDNPALMRANSLVDNLLCVYVIDFAWRSSNKYPLASTGKNARAFLDQSLDDLNQSLKKLGQQLIVIESHTVTSLTMLIEQFEVSDVIRSDHAGWYENQYWHELSKTNQTVNFHSVDTHSLFSLESLPFSLDALPTSFTKFRKAVSEIKTSAPITEIAHLPKPPTLTNIDCINLNTNLNKSFDKKTFVGGETKALAHLEKYFSSDKPSLYKHVRNALDGWDNSCKLSPWLANGSLSVREVVSVLSEYEKKHGANESTYWIFFELLWREYFQWYALKNGRKIFSYNGIKRLSPLTSYYPERFQKWVNGSTPYPLVNACMNELRQTGYLSNRGRQIVASCFVNELAMDWRYGAAYFEQALIDYDVASNWGNWQYLAGVGADTRDKRHFNLEKQTQQFDPKRRYIKKWNGDSSIQLLDSVDAADWPII